MIWILLIYAILLVSTFVHELGHAIAMKKFGLTVEAIFLGLGKPAIRFRLKRIFPNAVIRLTPFFIVGGKTKTEERNWDFLDFREKLIIDGAGVVANLYFAGILLAGIVIAAFLKTPDASVLQLCMILFALGAMGLLVWLFEETFCKYVIPIAGALNILMFVALPVVFLAFSPSEGMRNLGYQYMQPSLGNIFILTFVVNVLLALNNMMPLYPLDGSKIVSDLIEKRWGIGAADRYAKYSSLSLLFLMGLCFSVIFFATFFS